MTLLTDSTWWQLLVFLIVAAIVLIVFIALLTKLVTKRKVGVSIGKFKMNADTGSSPSENGHQHCDKHRDFIIVMHLSIESAKRTFELERITTISEQMSFAEQCLSDLRQELRSKFLKVLKEVKGMEQPDGLLSTHEAHDYNNVLRILNFELKDYIRRIFLENHMTEMSEKEFDEYVTRRVKYLNEVVTEILDDAYPSNVSPSRERVYAANTEMARTIDELFADMLKHGRFIAFENAEKAKQIEAETDAKIEEILKGEQTGVS